MIVMPQEQCPVGPGKRATIRDLVAIFARNGTIRARVRPLRRHGGAAIHGPRWGIDKAALENQHERRAAAILKQGSCDRRRPKGRSSGPVGVQADRHPPCRGKTGCRERESDGPPQVRPILTAPPSWGSRLLRSAQGSAGLADPEDQSSSPSSVSSSFQELGAEAKG